MLIQGGATVEATYEGGHASPASGLSVSLSEDPSIYGPDGAPAGAAWVCDVWVRTTTGKFHLGRHFEQTPTQASNSPHARVILVAFCPGAVQWYCRFDGSQMPPTVRAEIELSARDCCAGYGVRSVPILDSPILGSTDRIVGPVVGTPTILPVNHRRTRAVVLNSDPVGGTGVLGVRRVGAATFGALVAGQSIELTTWEAIEVTELAPGARVAWFEETDG